MINLIDLLERRGFIAQLTDESIREFITRGSTTLYVGFDPTADSLHLGHLVPVMMMAHFQRHGHKVLAVVGGATGMIGDPSGKSEERNLLTAEQIEKNVNAVGGQLGRLLDFSGDNAAMLLNNFDWIGRMSFIDWLRDVGKYFTVNYMVAKDSVKSRMSSEAGISFTEFSYMTLQAYDFLYLFDQYGCTLQAGGNDQWGNITAGTDLIRKVRGMPAYGITCPLLATASGAKFGKTAGNAVWLDAERTSPYQFYQYWVRTEDADVERFLKLFTFLELEEIADIIATHQQAPERREAQKRLAAEATRMIHGDEGLTKAQNATQALFGGDLSEMSARDLLDVFADVPSTELDAARLDGEGLALVDLLAESGLCKSKSDARRMITQGAIYVNNQRIGDVARVLNRGDLLSETVMVLRSGKKKYQLVRIP